MPRESGHRIFESGFCSETRSTSAARGNASAICRGKLQLISSEELFPVFDKTDDHDDGRPDETEKKHGFHEPHYKSRQNHTVDSTPTECFKLGPVCIYRHHHGSCGPQLRFLPCCWSCRSRSRGPCRRGDRCSHGSRWFHCFGRCWRMREAGAGILSTPLTRVRPRGSRVFAAHSSSHTSA